MLKKLSVNRKSEACSLSEYSIMKRVVQAKLATVASGLMRVIGTPVGNYYDSQNEAPTTTCT